MDIECFLEKAKTSAIKVAQDDIVQITIGSIKSFRSAIVSSGDTDSLELTEVLERGCPVPLEFVHFETGGERPPTGFYVVEWVKASEQISNISFRNIENEEALPYKLVFNLERGISSENASALDRDLDNFAYANYVNFCGSWILSGLGGRRRSRICTGGSCGGIPVCIQSRTGPDRNPLDD